MVSYVVWCRMLCGVVHFVVSYVLWCRMFCAYMCHCGVMVVVGILSSLSGYSTIIPCSVGGSICITYLPPLFCSMHVCLLDIA